MSGSLSLGPPHGGAALTSDWRPDRGPVRKESGDFILRFPLLIVTLSALLGCGVAAPGTAGITPETHVLAEGETLASIAATYDLEVTTVVHSNWEHLRDDPTNLEPGMEIVIPPEDGVLYRWSEGDTLAGVASFFDVAPEVILTYPGNNLTEEMIISESLQDLPPGTLIFILGGSRPLVGPLPQEPGFSDQRECVLWYPTLPPRCTSSTD